MQKQIEKNYCEIKTNNKSDWIIQEGQGNFAEFHVGTANHELEIGHKGTGKVEKRYLKKP